MSAVDMTIAPSMPLRLPAGHPPMLVVIIDTEEECPWGSYSRQNTAVRAMRRARRAQVIFDQFGIRPAYLVDYPVASQPDGYLPLKEFADAGSAVIGAHCHPWVNPPHEEPVTLPNTFHGNLEPPLESAKLRILTETIEGSFGARPKVFKAGRYGFGPHTASILVELGYLVDCSPSPAFDFTREGGPDYSGWDAGPRWWDAGQRLLALPTTGAFVGFLRAGGARLHRLMATPAARALRCGGVLSRLGAFERIRLSPEGFTFAEMRRLTEDLLGRGVQVMTFSFHSPSLEPGNTPYVRGAEELSKFLDLFRRYFDFWFSQIQGRASTPLELRQQFLPSDSQSI